MSRIFAECGERYERHPRATHCHGCVSVMSHCTEHTNKWSYIRRNTYKYTLICDVMHMRRVNWKIRAPPSCDTLPWMSSAARHRILKLCPHSSSTVNSYIYTHTRNMEFIFFMCHYFPSRLCLQSSWWSILKCIFIRETWMYTAPTCVHTCGESDESLLHHAAIHYNTRQHTVDTHLTVNGGGEVFL